MRRWSAFRTDRGAVFSGPRLRCAREDWAVACERWEAVRGGFPDQSSGYERGTVALLNAGRLEEAEGLACEAMERFPDRPGGCVQRAEVAMRREDWAVAIGRWEAVRGGFPDHASGYVRGAEALLNAGRLGEAEGLAEEAVGRFRERPGSYLRCAELAMRRGEWGLACERWEAVRVAFPQEASGYVRGAEALVEAGRLGEAEGLACEALERFPDRPGGCVQRAEVAMRREDWAGAIGRWEAVRGAFPDQSSGYERGTVALLNAGRLGEAEGLACEAMERFPDRPGGCVQRAEVAMRREDWAVACERWEAVRGAFPDHASGYVRGAEALLNAGRLEETEGLACEAMERFPDRPGGCVQRAEAAMRREEWAVAIGRWEAVRGGFPDQSSGYERGTVALLNAGRLGEAEALAEEAVVRFRERPGSYLRCAELAMRREDWAVACERWEAVRGAFPQEASGYVRGAEALVEAGRVEEAEGLAEEAMERFPEHPGGYVQRAEAAMRREEWAVACERWEELRRVSPDQSSGYERGTVALLNAGRLGRRRLWPRRRLCAFPSTLGGTFSGPRRRCGARSGRWRVSGGRSFAEFLRTSRRGMSEAR